MIVRRFHRIPSLLYEKPTNLKNKKLSSQKWILRQLKDPYVEMARQENYRCRSAFKLLEINKKYNILQPGFCVVDCGAAPGSWTQVAVKLTNSNEKVVDQRRGKVIAIDILPIHDIEGATTLGNLDFTTNETFTMVKDCLKPKFADVVMSDMAPNATGIKELDHENIIKLAYSAFKFAILSSTYNATLIVKVWDGTESLGLEKDIEKFYKNVKIVKPVASRSESSEKFILARGFKGLSPLYLLNN
ncbi:PREDICTED: rRNA methyltransferase 2, mitochondrial [Ceratosolen solmsi marchali]|uniref:rRNA methyltransferase 2, mitochondrial n=1 Tax=Ceratosolen solmsi marchali TaxID=326594 RepID=A0AAJ7DVW0_9HYME|nr:PREDICTED: rRNA methyltransferase 2, mitochondrial [Ceratosolen solmsi marchali]